MINRLQYFDVLRGVAILLVVMGHVIAMCIRGIDQTPLFKFASEIHMPLFFFISGWFAFGPDLQKGPKKACLRKRALRLLVPMVVVSSIWIAYFPFSGLKSPLASTFYGLWISPWKNGYWFTLCLFEIFLIYALVRPILAKTKTISSDILVTLAVWISLIIFFFVLRNTELGLLCGLELLATYWPAFMIGFIASKFRGRFETLVQSPVCLTAILIFGGFLLYYICWWWEFPGSSLFQYNEYNLIFVRPFFHFCLAVIAIALFRNVCSRYTYEGTRQPMWLRWLTVWGVNSLGIYLLHFFFLYPLDFMRQFAMGVNFGLVPMLLVSLVSALLIITVVMGVIRILNLSPWLTYLFTGDISKLNRIDG